MSYKLDHIRKIEIEGTDMIFDAQFTPTKNNVLALVTIEGDVIM